jgi:hypothetical protein
MSARSALVVAVAVAALAACGSSSTAPDAGPPDAGADASAADAGDNCNELAPLGGPVAATCAPDAPTPATGGTIADGTYVLTQSLFFGTCSSSTLDETLLVSGGTVQSVAVDANGVVIRKSVTTTVAGSGTALVEAQTCPPGLIVTVGFSATPTTLTIYLVNALGTRVSIFTRM